MNDGIRYSGLILKAQKDEATGRAGTLPGDHSASDARIRTELRNRVKDMPRMFSPLLMLRR
jgi:hypothetical protein